MDIESKKKYINVIGNHIYFYGPVDDYTTPVAIRAINKLNNSIKKTKNLDDTYKIKNDDEDSEGYSNQIIYFHINSYGGNLTDGMAIADTIRLSKIPVYTIVEGAAASIASIILLAGKKRFMTRNSFILIHELRTFFDNGTFSNISDEYNNCKLFMDMLKKIYSTQTKITKKELDELLKKDIWLKSDRCLKLGFVNKVL